MYLLGLDKCVIPCYFSLEPLKVKFNIRNALQSIGMGPKPAGPNADAKEKEKTEVRLGDRCGQNGADILLGGRNRGKDLCKHVSLSFEEWKLETSTGDRREGVQRNFVIQLHTNATGSKALAKNDKNFKAMFRKGKALGEQGFFEKALKVLEKLKTENPSGMHVMITVTEE